MTIYLYIILCICINSVRIKLWLWPLIEFKNNMITFEQLFIECNIFDPLTSEWINNQVLFVEAIPRAVGATTNNR